MYSSINPCFSEAQRYIEQLDWWLVPIRGIGRDNRDDGKAPIYKGWPVIRPGIEQLHVMLEQNGDAGIGLHLGGSGLIDLEGDSEQGEAILEQLCRGFEFPCYRSKKSKHRLFHTHDAVAYLKIEDLGIEVRAGKHQSVLPPSVVVGEKKTQYQWLVSPFDCPPPPLPDRILAFYLSTGKTRRTSAIPSRASNPRPDSRTAMIVITFFGISIS